MRSFVIFHRTTGEILQVHTQQGDFRSDRDELLRIGRAEAMDEIDVVETEGLAPSGIYRVDVKTRKLVPAKNEAGGSSGASLQPLGGVPRTARTVVRQMKEGKRPH